MKGSTAANGVVHAPRHSFNKRAFGRDLSNLQQNQPVAESNKQ